MRRKVSELQGTFDLGVPPPPMLDRAATREVIEDAVFRAENLTNEDRKAVMLDAIHQAARRNHYLTADQVWEHLGEVGDSYDDGSGLGPVMRIAATDRIIENTKTFRRSERPATHGKPLPVWKSLIFTEENTNGSH